MKRKIIKLGDTTHVISLPAVWFRDNELGAGDELEVEIAGPDLRVSTKKDPNLEKITLYLKNLSKSSIAAHLKAAYVKGYGEIKLIVGDGSAIETVQDIFSSMIGFEIIEQAKDIVIIKDLSYEGEISPIMIIKKCFAIISSCSEDGLKAVKNGDKKVLSELKERDFVLNRFINFYLRKIIQNKWVVEKDSKLLFSFINLLEYLGDHYSNMSKALSKQDDAVHNDVVEFWEYMNKMTQTISENFFEFNNEAIVMILDSIHKLNKRIDVSLMN